VYLVLIPGRWAIVSTRDPASDLRQPLPGRRRRPVPPNGTYNLVAQARIRKATRRKSNPVAPSGAVAPGVQPRLPLTSRCRVPQGRRRTQRQLSRHRSSAARQAVVVQCSVRTAEPAEPRVVGISISQQGCSNTGLCAKHGPNRLRPRDLMAPEA
jgi:hypothetical protein